MDNGTAPATEAAAAATNILQTFFLILFVGFVISTALYGITLLQGLYYFRTYTKDPWYLKSLTAFLLILDTLSPVLNAEALHFYLIKNFGNFNIGQVVPVNLPIENVAPTLITFLVQSFYAHQIWKLSKNKPFIIILEVLIVTSFALGIEVTVRLVQTPSTADISQRNIEIPSGFIQGLYAICDIMITASLCWLLHSQRTGIKQTEKLLDRLIILAINRGLVTAVAQIVYLLLNAPFPGKFYWFPFHQAIGKLYTNSYLAMLNIRGYSRRDNQGGPGETITSLRFEDGGLLPTDLRSAVRSSLRGRMQTARQESLGDLQLGKIDQSSNQSFTSGDAGSEITPIPLQVLPRNRVTGRDASASSQ